MHAEYRGRQEGIREGGGCSGLAGLCDKKNKNQEKSVTLKSYNGSELT